MVAVKKKKREKAPAKGQAVAPVEAEIRIEYMPLSDLLNRRWSNNPKLHDFDLIGASFKRFGFVDPIIINEATGTVLAGHGRIETLNTEKAAGKKAPDRIKVEGDEWLAPVLRGISFKTDEEATGYAIVSNRATERGGWDEDKLLISLQPLSELDDGLFGIGYDADDLERMSAWGSDGLPADIPDVDMDGTNKSDLNDTVVIRFDDPAEGVLFREILGIKPNVKTVAGVMILEALKGSGQVEADGQ